MRLVRSSPGRLRGGRPGFVLGRLLLIAAAAATGCDRVPGLGEEIELDEGSIRLPPEVDLHEVTISIRDGREVIDPDRIEARSGDAVRFVAGDGSGHAVAFDERGLGPDARGFLERTSQQAGPPLISSGTAWIFSLENAPGGTYTFHCLSHGQGGALVVEATAER
ncbi:MAG: cupredoxin domain-containing protein [Longimicrobiales bacterium]